jgi:hypothetical protein
MRPSDHDRLRETEGILGAAFAVVAASRGARMVTMGSLPLTVGVPKGSGLRVLPTAAANYAAASA